MNAKTNILILDSDEKRREAWMPARSQQAGYPVLQAAAHLEGLRLAGQAANTLPLIILACDCLPDLTPAQLCQQIQTSPSSTTYLRGDLFGFRSRSPMAWRLL